MTHGLLYRVQLHQPLAFSAWSARRVRPSQVADGVIPVHVRRRQQDVGVLYQRGAGIQTTPLATYQAGEQLDFYA